MLHLSIQTTHYEWRLGNAVRIRVSPAEVTEKKNGFSWWRKRLTSCFIPCTILTSVNAVCYTYSWRLCGNNIALELQRTNKTGNQRICTSVYAFGGEPAVEKRSIKPLCHIILHPSFDVSSCICYSSSLGIIRFPLSDRTYLEATEIKTDNLRTNTNMPPDGHKHRTKWTEG